MRALAALLLLALAACGAEREPIAAADARIRLEASHREVHPGQGFRLTAVRVWRKGFEPSPWDDALLSPLVLRAEGVETREDGRRVEETRRFDAYVFSRKDVTVPAVPFAAKPDDGSELRIAASRPLRLSIVPQVDADDPGAPELPGDLPGGGFPWWALLGVLVLLQGGFLLLLRARRPAAAPPAPPRDPRAEALAQLETIQRSGDVDADMQALTAVLRGYVAQRDGVPARARTTEELASVPGVAEILAPCDAVLFARQLAGPREVEALHERVRDFVRNASGGGRTS